MLRVPRAAAVTGAALVGAVAAAPASAAVDRRPELRARAVLPADTLALGPVSGTAIGPGPFNRGRRQTIESLLVQDRRTLLVADDDDLPFSSGRRPGEPDDDEIVEVRLPRPLAARSR